MLMTIYDLNNFRLVDDATGQEVKEARWLDTDAMEYGVIAQPPRFLIGTFALVTDSVKFTAIRFDYANAEIHINEPPRVVQGYEGRVERPCEECCQEDTCRRIHYCAAWRCNFGEVAKP